MSYIRPSYNGRSRTLGGLGDDAPSCRTGAAFFKDGNWWVPIRDGNGKEYPLMQTSALLAMPMCAAGSSAGGLLSTLIGGVTDVLKAKVTPAPTSTTIVQGGSGISTPVKLAVAGAGVVALLMIMKSRK